jgi:beta-N-acetylhexosaminidase
MLDIGGADLDGVDRERLRHPLVGGVILFSRNYDSPQQLRRLSHEIHVLRNPPLIIAVDQEGGRVQRFREHFTALPAMRVLGRAWDESPHRARVLARATGLVMAAELRAHGIDLSLAPVLDVDHGNSSVIGDRAFHSDPQVVAELARNLALGMRDGGMASVGKHFPGHGYVQADSHLQVPVDDRSYTEIERCDMLPFRRLASSVLGGVMPAHVIYPQIDQRPAGFSSVWLTTILRGALGFRGVIFSDDLSMEGAAAAGDIRARAETALHAGCDMALVCNAPTSADELLDNLRYTMPAVTLARLARMHGRPQPKTMTQLREDADYMEALHALAAIAPPGDELPLGS